jgi:hypothetical protein
VKADDDQGPEAKPWATFPINDEFCVYRIDEQGERMGDSLGCHATDEAAQAQIRALYASENAGKDEETEGELIESINQEMRAAVTDNAPPEMAAAETDQGQEKAGPVQPPTSEVTLGEVEVWMAEIEMELLEVE